MEERDGRENVLFSLTGLDVVHDPHYNPHVY